MATSQMSLKNAALISGMGLLIMTLSAPVVEFYIFPNIKSDDALTTARNVIEYRTMWTSAIFLHLVTILCDILVSWSFYLLFKRVNQQLSLLTAWCRLIYTATYLIALLNLVKVYTLTDGLTSGDETIALAETAQLYISSFTMEWSFALSIFGIYLSLLGSLVIKSGFIPKWIGFLVIIAGLGYIFNTITIFYFPDQEFSFVLVTFIGELILMIWLLLRANKLRGQV